MLYLFWHLIWNSAKIGHRSDWKDVYVCVFSYNYRSMLLLLKNTINKDTYYTIECWGACVCNRLMIYIWRLMIRFTFSKLTCLSDIRWMKKECGTIAVDGERHWFQNDFSSTYSMQNACIGLHSKPIIIYLFLFCTIQFIFFSALPGQERGLHSHLSNNQPGKGGEFYWFSCRWFV